MYLAIDIGGTKTLLACLNNEGVITQRVRFETPKSYQTFKKLLAQNVASLTTKGFKACGVGAPGRVDHKRNVVAAFGNLPWVNTPLQADVEALVTCPVVIENDANLAGLSEAMLLKEKYSRVLYITISTGIGTGFIVNQKIEAVLAGSEGGQLLLEHQDKLMVWEDFASGRAIVSKYGKRAEDITDEKTWKQIAHSIALGLIELCVVLQPEIIVIGGSVGRYLDRFKKPLVARLKELETPLVPAPRITEAKRPDDAVLYGCYDLAKSLYGRAST